MRLVIIRNIKIGHHSFAWNSFNIYSAKKFIFNVFFFSNYIYIFNFRWSFIWNLVFLDLCFMTYSPTILTVCTTYYGLFRKKTQATNHSDVQFILYLLNPKLRQLCPCLNCPYLISPMSVSHKHVTKILKLSLNKFII